MITVYKNPNGDTRTADKGVTFEEFEKANTSHIEDVRNAMDFISDMILSAGEFHDCTKKTQEKMFYEDFKHTLETGEDFTKGKWYQLHITAERHHLDYHCPDDVNLIDILEMIADRVCAGMARSGEVYDLNLSSELLQKAVKNTVELVKERVEVIDPTPKKLKSNEDTNQILILDDKPMIDPTSSGFYTSVKAPIVVDYKPEAKIHINDFPYSGVGTGVNYSDHSEITGTNNYTDHTITVSEGVGNV